MQLIGSSPALERLSAGEQGSIERHPEAFFSIASTATVLEVRRRRRLGGTRFRQDFCVRRRRLWGQSPS